MEDRLRQLITDVSQSAPAPANTTDDIFCNYYTQWTQWNKCNKHCMQSRKRKCKDRKVCGKARFKEKRACDTEKKRCPNHQLQIFGGSPRNRLIEDKLYDIFYRPWSEWSPCNRKCVRRRRRRCKRLNICAGGYLEEQRQCSKTEGKCKKSYTFVTKPFSKTAPSTMGTTDIIAQNVTVTFNGLRSICGMRPLGTSRTTRIVGGRESVPNSWPWQVEIITKRKKHLCGGTLISPRWVVTAAHCIKKRMKRAKMLVRLGEHNRKVHEGTENDIEIKTYKPHPKFDYTTVMNDIALLELKKPIAVTNITGYACLPTRKQKTRKDDLCITVGWGRTNITNRRGSKVLREVQIPIAKRKKCKKAFSFRITKFHICAGFKSGGKDACVGDSGGPLMCPHQRGKQNRWYVSGVTSYGEGCGQKNKFGIYVNVAKYISWIRKEIGKRP